MAISNIRSSSADGGSSNIEIAQGAGNNRVVVALISGSHWDTNSLWTSVTLNGVPGESIAVSGGGTGQNYKAQAFIWYDGDLPATAGTYALAANGGNGNGRRLSAFSCSGASQSAPVDAVGSTLDFRSSCSATISGTGSYAFMASLWNWGSGMAVTLGTNEVALYNGQTGASNWDAHSYDPVGGAITHTYSANEFNAYIAFGVTAAAGVIPVLSSPTPADGATVGSSPTLGCTTNTPSGTARIVVDSVANLAGVTAAQVLAGQKANGTAALGDTGNIAVSTTSISSSAVTGLPSGAYAAATAQNAGSTSSVLTWNFTVDVTAPAFTSGPIAIAITDTGATITGTANEAGTASLIVTPPASSQPSDAAFDASGATTSITANMPFSIPHTGENPGTARTAWVQLKDATGNRATASANFTTTARAVTLQLVGSAGTLANKSLRAWSRQTISSAAVDGGGTGLNVTTDGNGILVLTGLTIAAGPGVVTLEDPADTYNSHNYHVVFD